MIYKHVDTSSALFVIREIKSNQIKTTMRFHFICTRMAKIKKTISVGEDMEKLQLSDVAGVL